MLLSQSQERLLKVVHIIVAAAWLGGAVSLSILLYVGNTQADSSGALVGVNLCYHWIDQVIVVFIGALGCTLTGLIYSLFTRWGFLRHRWILAKWIITALMMTSGTFLLGPGEARMLEMSRELGLNALTNPLYEAVFNLQVIMAGVQILCFITIIYLSVCKPWRAKPKTPKTYPSPGDSHA